MCGSLAVRILFKGTWTRHEAYNWMEALKIFQQLIHPPAKLLNTRWVELTHKILTLQFWHVHMCCPDVCVWSQLWRWYLDLIHGTLPYSSASRSITTTSYSALYLWLVPDEALCSAKGSVERADRWASFCLIPRVTWGEPPPPSSLHASHQPTTCCFSFFLMPDPRNAKGPITLGHLHIDSALAKGTNNHIRSLA